MATRRKKTTRSPKGDGTCYARTVTRRDGTKRQLWACQINVQEGRLTVRKTFYGRTQAEARAKRDAYKVLPPTERRARDKRRVDGFLDEWIEAKEAECCPATVHAYKWAINEYVKPHIGERNLCELDALDIDTLLNTLRKDKCSTRTLKAVFVTLRAAFNFAVHRRVIPISPMHGLKAPKHRASKITPLTREQARRFLKAAKGDRLYALYVLALTCGLRQGELFGVRWCDVDFRSGRLAVRRQVTEVGAGPPHLVEHTKSGRDRSVKLPPDAIAALREHQKRRLATGDIANELLFTTPEGALLSKWKFVRHSFQPLLEKAECPRVRFHDLRHTAATLAFEEGQHPKKVQEMLGHASVTLTLDTYSAFIPTMQDELAMRCNAHCLAENKP